MGSQKVLVVDDEEVVREMVGLVLRKEGYQVYEAENGANAQSIMEAQPEIALVMTDLIMPGMNGLEFCAWIKARFPGVKILLLSGSPNFAAALSKAPPELQAVPFLAKPFPLKTLVGMVRETLDSSGNSPA